MGKIGRVAAALIVLAFVVAGCGSDGHEAPGHTGSTHAPLIVQLFSGVDHFAPPLAGGTTLKAVSHPPSASWAPPQCAPAPSAYDAESELMSETGTDFVYNACIDLPPGGGTTSGDLQFRISNEGRYGVAIEPDPAQPAFARVRFYRMKRRTGLTTTAGDAGICEADSYLYDSNFGIGSSDVASLSSPVGQRHCVQVTASGLQISIAVDGTPALTVEEDASRALRTGRFGLYTLSPVNLAETVFTNVSATTDVAAAANFATLFNTVGYETKGTKRALVRSIALGPTSPVDVAASGFQLVSATSGQVQPTSNSHLRAGTMFGMRLWEADFTDVQTPGDYFVKFMLSGPNFYRELTTGTFKIGERVASNALLKGLSIQNARARNAAVEDLTNNWQAMAGAWTVDADGAFVATNADAGVGAVLQRNWNGYLKVEDSEVDCTPNVDCTLNSEFVLTSDVAVVNGCDAAIQFWINGGKRYAVTLRAGSNGKCASDSNSGVRLSIEDAGGYQILKENNAFPIEAATSHDVWITVTGPARMKTVTVSVDGKQAFPDQPSVPIGDTAGAVHPGPERGKFGLSAFNATARFDKLRVYKNGVAFTDVPTDYSGPPEHVAITPPLPAPALFANLTCEEAAAKKLGEPGLHDLCYPLSAQRHGNHDCNNFIQEAASHGPFLAGLMEVWTRRRSTLTPTEQSDLKSAILTADGYLADLYRHGRNTGRFVHAQPSSGGVEGAIGYHNTVHAAYGESAFAVRGGDIDPSRARAACLRLTKAVDWLIAEEQCISGNGCVQTPIFGGTASPWYDDTKSLLRLRVAQCAQQFGTLAASTIESHKTAARTAALAWSGRLASSAANETRDIGHFIPWLEGIDEFVRAFPTDSANSTLIANLTSLATAMGEMGSFKDPSHVPQAGFQIIPEADGDGAQNSVAWSNTHDVPIYTRRHNGSFLPTDDPALLERRGYLIGHFAASAYDASVLVRLLGSGTAAQATAEKVGAGSVGWALGLNPGLPTSKVVNQTASEPWVAAAFVSGKVPYARARGFNGFFKYDTRRKPVFPTWGEADNDYREAWWINPNIPDANNPDALSMLNGHIIIARNTSGGPEGQFDYWNQGRWGWESGETFMAIDGAFLKGLLSYEDAVTNVPPPVIPQLVYPKDTKRPQFFDVTPQERLATGWGFGNVNSVTFARASRMAHNFCIARGFVSGHPTGHQNPTTASTGVFCFPTQSSVRDVTAAEAGFSDIETVSWAQAARSAQALCSSSTYVDATYGARTYVGGAYTGHQLPMGGPRGLACLRLDSGSFYNSTWQEHYNSGEGFADVNTVHWAQAGRAAANMCGAKGFGAGGFLNGTQFGTGSDVTKPLVCVANTGETEPFPETMAGLVSVANNAGSTALAVYPSSGTALFSPWTQWSTAGGWDSSQRSLSGDFDGDGKTDVATVWNDNNTNSFAMRRSTGASFTVSTWLANSGGWSPATIWLSGDFTGGGRTDIAGVWNNGGNTSIAVWASTGAGFAAPTQWLTNAGWDSTAQWLTGDFDHDGRDDIATIWNDAGYNTFAMRRSTGASFTVGTWLARNGLWASSTKWLAGDFTGDQYTDIASVAYSGGNTSVAMWRSFATGFAPGVTWSTTAGWDPYSKWVSGDFDADGRCDIATIWQNGSLSTIALRRNMGGSFSASTWLADGGLWSSSTAWFSGRFL